VRNIFNTTDVNTGVVTTTDGLPTVYEGVNVHEFDCRAGTDGFQIAATTATSNVAILTGSGNDTIDVSHVVRRMSFIDAGAGTNTITCGPGVTNITERSTAVAPNTQPWTSDIISNFRPGDHLTFVGVTSIYETVRGTNTMFSAWNAAVPGSAVYATFAGVSPGISSQVGDHITLSL
jgi:hypothetical protein